MIDTGQYASVALEGIEPVAIAGGFGMDGIVVNDEAKLRGAIKHGLDVVMNDQLPYLIDVKLPLGLPEGGTPAEVWKLGG
jgi:thiamine pyrophosphate-dependent acetolactate synthase large subunit-like protein